MRHDASADQSFRISAPNSMIFPLSAAALSPQ
jgi:hypothetical protein